MGRSLHSHSIIRYGYSSEFLFTRFWRVNYKVEAKAAQKHLLASEMSVFNQDDSPEGYSNPIIFSSDDFM